jgi:hypothetical protein
VFDANIEYLEASLQFGRLGIDLALLGGWGFIGLGIVGILGGIGLALRLGLALAGSLVSLAFSDLGCLRCLGCLDFGSCGSCGSHMSHLDLLSHQGLELLLQQVADRLHLALLPVVKHGPLIFWRHNPR